MASRVQSGMVVKIKTGSISACVHVCVGLLYSDVYKYLLVLS